MLLRPADVLLGGGGQPPQRPVVLAFPIDGADAAAAVVLRQDRPDGAVAAPELPGLSAGKAERLRGVARAAQDGRLDRDRLRRAPVDEALAALEALPGIGPFFARGILYRGAGVVDAATADDVTELAVAERYGAGASLADLADQWRPYRTWAIVLLHVWVRTDVGLPRRRPPAAGPAATRSRRTAPPGGSRSPPKALS